MINFNPSNVNFNIPQGTKPAGNTEKLSGKGNDQFSKAVDAADKYLSEVDKLQHNSDASVKELLSGKNQDINSVVSEVAKADMSFKLLIGVRNKLIEAYKETMNMPL